MTGPRRRRRRSEPLVQGGLVRCANGAVIHAWIEDGRLDALGWEMPYFTDGAMERIADTYFASAPDRAPTQGLSGSWVFIDDEGEFVPLDRRRVEVFDQDDGTSKVLALTDGSDMGWCWERHVPIDPVPKETKGRRK